MNKKILSCTVAMLTLFLGVSSVNAKCSYAEQAALNKEAKNINVKYEAISERVWPMPEGYECDGDEDCLLYNHYVNIHVLNLSKNFYIDVKDSVTKKSQKYYFSDVPEDGILKIKWDDVSQINSFTITAYSSDETSCADTKIKTMHITTPRRNIYSDYDMCKEIPDYYLCKDYVTYEKDPTFDEFVNKVETEIKKQNEEKKKKEQEGFFDKLLEFIGKYKGIVIAGTAVIIILVAGTVIIIRKKKKL